MDFSRSWFRMSTVFVVLLALLAVLAPGAAADSVTTPDVGTPGNGVGFDPSLVLDSSGYPVVAYKDRAGSQLKVLHCGDPTCDGTSDSITAPDPTTLDHGDNPSLVLDSSGYPVVAYTERAQLRILHCDDPNCDGVGDTVNGPDSSAALDSDPHVVLDNAGNPVVAYGTNPDNGGPNTIRLLRCDDPLCDGVGETLTDVGVEDLTSSFSMRVFGPSTVVLGAAGNPIISYFVENEGMNLLVCDDPNCSGGGETTTVLPEVSRTMSMVLDAARNPVIAFQGGATNVNDIMVLHCDDPACDGTGDTLTTPDTDLSGFSISLQLDSAGNPVMAYYRGGGEWALTVMHCDDPNCAGIEAASEPDESSNPNQGVSLALDSAGYPVVAHNHFANGELRVVRCDDAACAPSLLCNGLPVTIDMNTGVAGLGTPGDDVILGTPGDDNIVGGDGDDTICGEDGNDTIDGGAGRDVIYGGEDNDTIVGGLGNDRIRGQQGVDGIAGGPGNDFLYGGIEGDVINGGDGNDTIGGFGGADVIDAGPGNDLVFGGFGADTIVGGPGADELRGLIGNDNIMGGTGDDEIYGDNGQDIVEGGAGDDMIFGGNSLDTLTGGDGNDNLNGGKSNDSLDGGAGVDVCTGNRGTDTASASCETIFGVP